MRTITKPALLLGFAGIPLLAIGQVEPLNGSRVPHAVLKDGTGEIVGPVVHFDGRYPTVLLNVGADRVLTAVTKEGLFMTHLDIFYSDSSCDGEVVGIQRREDFVHGGVYEMQGSDYAIGKGNILYQDIEGTDSTKTPGSRWNVGFLAMPNSDPCETTSSSRVLRGAEIVDDLNTIYVAPFHIE